MKQQQSRSHTEKRPSRTVGAGPRARKHSERTRTTKAEQREASVEKLLAAALRLFVSYGYRATTLEQIAAAAGLTKGAVYFYFRSKEAVLIALLDRVETLVVDPVIERLKEPQASAIDKVVIFFHHQAQLGIPYRGEILLLILMSLEFSDREGEAGQRVRAIGDKLHKRIERVITEGRLQGTIRKDVPAKELTAILLALHDGVFLEWHRRGSTLNGRDLVRAVRAITLGGVKA